MMRKLLDLQTQMFEDFLVEEQNGGSRACHNESETRGLGYWETTEMSHNMRRLVFFG